MGEFKIDKKKLGEVEPKSNISKKDPFTNGVKKLITGGLILGTLTLGASNIEAKDKKPEKVDPKKVTAQGLTSIDIVQASEPEIKFDDYQGSEIESVPAPVIVGTVSYEEIQDFFKHTEQLKKEGKLTEFGFEKNPIGVIYSKILAYAKRTGDPITRELGGFVKYMKEWMLINIRGPPYDKIAEIPPESTNPFSQRYVVNVLNTIAGPKTSDEWVGPGVEVFKKYPNEVFCIPISTCDRYDKSDKKRDPIQDTKWWTIQNPDKPDQTILIGADEGMITFYMYDYKKNKIIYDLVIIEQLGLKLGEVPNLSFYPAKHGNDADFYGICVMNKNNVDNPAGKAEMFMTFTPSFAYPLEKYGFFKVDPPKKAEPRMDITRNR